MARETPRNTIDGRALDDGLRATITRRLHDAGQRLTSNREVIVEILADADRPLTIADILAGRPGLAQCSVYRNLLVLEQADVVRKVVAHDDFAHFELAEGLIEHHHHLICSACGTVEDVPASAGLERSLRTAVDEIARTTGFRAEAHRIDLVGLCRRCA
ncbi:MAG: Fur family transcriptional regulator [Actinomycetota bacterium]